MVKDIQTEVAEAVVAYAADTRQSAETQRERTLAMDGPPNLKGMRRRSARALVPRKRVKAAHRKLGRGTSLRAWAARLADEGVRAWLKNKKPPRLKLIKQA